eukprot:1947777-Amphidinium_carterae.1
MAADATSSRHSCQRWETRNLTKSEPMLQVDGKLPRSYCTKYDGHASHSKRETSHRGRCR